MDAEVDRETSRGRDQLGSSHRRSRRAVSEVSTLSKMESCRSLRSGSKHQNHMFIIVNYYMARKPEGKAGFVAPTSLPVATTTSY
jgi:hypothetical protein